MVIREVMFIALISSGTAGQISLVENGDSSSDVVTNLALSPAVNMIHASWQLLNPSGNVHYFNVSWTHRSQPLQNCIVRLPATNTADCYRAPLLAPCANYTVTVQPRAIVTDNGVPSSATDYTLSAAPPAPPAVSCTLLGPFVSVRWTTPSAECDIVSNTVSWEGDVLWSDQQDSNNTTTNGTTNRITLTQTVPYTSYTVSVATTVIGEVTGAARSCKVVTPEEAPSAPQNLTVAKARSSSLSLTWQPPEDINGVLRSYVITWGVGNDTDSFVKDGDTLSYKILGLEEETPYNISVKAVTIHEGAPAEISIRTPSISSPHAWALVLVIITFVVIFILFKRDMNRAER